MSSSGICTPCLSSHISTVVLQRLVERFRQAVLGDAVPERFAAASKAQDENFNAMAEVQVPDTTADLAKVSPQQPTMPAATPHARSLSLPQAALILKGDWPEMILSGRKTWEIRSM